MHMNMKICIFQNNEAVVKETLQGFSEE